MQGRHTILKVRERVGLWEGGREGGRVDPQD